MNKTHKKVFSWPQVMLRWWPFMFYKSSQTYRANKYISWQRWDTVGMPK